MNKTIQRIGMVVGVFLGIAAIVKEFSQPRGLRVGQGSVLGVPYSFRIPNGEEIKRRYWNANGLFIAPPILGVGVWPNIPALLKQIGLWPK